MNPAISVQGLHKRYGDFEAVKGIDFEVGAGEVFGLLGPNGAGKTSTVEILEGLRERSAGTVQVLGFDPAVQAKQLKDRIGVCLQATNLPEKLTVQEALVWFGAFYSRNSDPDQLLARLQLKEKRNAPYATLSGGQKQRVAIALALVNDPQVVFFDEPTTGLDAQVRLEIHALIQELKDSQRTIVLTTHYIEEAERLCDRVAIVDQGRIIAQGTPREIQARTMGQSGIDLELKHPAEKPPEGLRDAQAVTLSDDRLHLHVASSRPERTIVDLVKWVEQSNLELADIRLKKPTLEDVFIELTGKSLRD